MLSKLFGKKKPAEAEPSTPEIIGLRLGGAFELDPLKLKLMEPKLVVQGVAPTQLIQAVGEVKLDEASWLLRFYTDDEAFLQVLLTGGRSENNLSDVKLWHFYDTQSVGSEADWKTLLENRISQPSIELEGHTYHRVWNGVGPSSPPVAMTETTHAEPADKETTDQFSMLYQREIGDDMFEYVIQTAEEKVVGERLDRCLVVSTGFDLNPADLTIIG